MADIPARGVYLKAFNRTGDLVLEMTLPTGEFYDKDQPIIDSSPSRRRRGIVRLEGTQVDSSGRVYKQWIASYDEKGDWLETVDLIDENPTRC